MGYGIDQSTIPKLFSNFTTKSKGGTGLGLFISKNIIDAHGGQIYAYNNKEGKGATFGFSLPILQQGIVKFYKFYNKILYLVTNKIY